MRVSSFNHDAMVKFVWPNPLPILSFQSKIMALLNTCCVSILLSVPTKDENQQGYLKINLLYSFKHVL